MAFSRTHSTAADGTFSAAGVTAWNAAHAVSGADVGGVLYCPTATSEATAAGFTFISNVLTAPTITATTGFVSTLGTITADAQTFSGTATWNNAGVTFTAFKQNITGTAFANGSMLFDWQQDGVSLLNLQTTIGVPTLRMYRSTSIRTYGDISFGTGGFVFQASGTGTDFSYKEASNVVFYVLPGSYVNIPSNSMYGISSSASNATTAPDTNLSRISAGVWGVGTGTAGSFAGGLKLTDLTINRAATFLTTSVALTNGAAASVGTLTNAPAAGNPTKWIGINDNGTTRYIPAW